MTQGDQPPESRPALAGVMARLPRPVQGLLAARRLSPRAQRVVLVVAAAVFVVGSVAAWRGLGLAPGELRLLPLLLVLALVPVTILVNAAELRVMAAALGGRLGWGDSARTVVVATAANLLPVPGAAVVRVQALRTAGVGLAGAALVNLAAALLWVGVAVTVAGAAAASSGRAVATMAILAGLTAVCGGGWLVHRAALTAASATRRVPAAEPVPSGATPAGPGATPARSAVGRLLAVEAATVVVNAARLILALAALDVTLEVRQALVIAAASPLAAAAGVFPSGLGLAEVLAALAAPLVGVPPEAGFAATAVNRLVGLVATAPLAVALGARLSARS